MLLVRQDSMGRTDEGGYNLGSGTTERKRPTRQGIKTELKKVLYITCTHVS